MASIPLDELELEDAWIEGDPTAVWRSATAHAATHGARSSGSSLLEVAPGCRLPRHTDSAEEVIVVLAGRAEVTVGDEVAAVAVNGLALVPKDVPHEVRNGGDEPLRFLALYAGTDVVTRYEWPVQPGGDAERKPLG
ncbi:MAG TPA: cupin domain-containing protein [Thermoleophilaceae bacterium]|nr:cupin domain-containing protein [Thermoleophilaceae bacterium]